MRISDRTEYQSKAPPLTCSPETSVYDAVLQMAEKNFGSIIVTDADQKVTGMMTERDIFKRVIAESRDPKTTSVGDVMTSEVRMANKDDKVLDWLQVMSNERFRRLPIVDEDKRLVSVMTQGDFVSYTWPQLLTQVSQMAQATLAPAFNPLAILGGVLVYSVILVIVLITFA